MNNISKHISWKEAVGNSISNKPTAKQLINMEKLAKTIFEPIREHFNVPIHIWSFFRSKSLNEAVKGSKTSQHLCNKGAAIDIDSDIYGYINNLDIIEYIGNNLEWDQLILEFPREDCNPEWVHISYNEGNNRNQILMATGNRKKPKYIDITKDIWIV